MAFPASLGPGLPRTVAGLMSGTSLDGVDVVIARLEGSGRGLTITVRAFVHRAYPPALRQLLLDNAAPEGSSVRALSQLNVRVAHEYAAVLAEAADEAGLPLDALDLIGSHGQTMHHVPTPADCAGMPTTSTFQIGDPSVLAQLTGIPVVGDFRLADMALGGQGAPLVPYFDHVFFGHATETRGLLNLGGIANLTVLPPGSDADAVIAFDTGPANMVLDALAQRLLGQPYDADGQHADAGTVHEALLADLLADPYFALAPPKSTGREHFGDGFTDRLMTLAAFFGIQKPEDLLATAAALTARTIFDAYDRFLRPHHPLDVLIASGGGVHNAFLMARLAALFAPLPLRRADDYGLDANAKEALCFAVLAHETLNGVPTSLPSVTGASRPARLGKLCLP